MRATHRRWTPIPGTLDERIVTGERPHKYGAKATMVDGIRFASQKEARRYQELKLLEQTGFIHALAVQPRYVLSAVPIDGVVKRGDRPHAYGAVLGIAVGEYRGDFVYCECKRGGQCQRSHLVVEDVKGFKTPLYRWKKRHMLAQYGIAIREV